MNTFSKKEKLCSKKLTDELFQSGNKFLVFPFSIHWKICQKEEIPAPAQVLIATSKRKFHHAVDRNKVKRLMRECYRTHKGDIYSILEEKNIRIIISINYIHNGILDYKHFDEKFVKMMKFFEKQLIEIEPTSTQS